MNKFKHVAILFALCLSLIFGQAAIGADVETVKKDINIIAQCFVNNAKVSSEVLGYLQYTDEIKDGNTTWYLIIVFVNGQPNMIYIQEEIATEYGTTIHFDGIRFTFIGLVDDCYAYLIDKDNAMTYLDGCIKAWDRGIEKFKNKYRL